MGRPGSFDPGYCEAGAPPVRLADGNYFTTYDTIIGSQRHSMPSLPHTSTATHSNGRARAIISSS